jgi:Uma2 family endonuclease
MAQPVDARPDEATAPRPRRMTYEEFLRSDHVWAEWVDGEVLELSPASLRHQLLSGFLSSLLRHFVEARRLGVVLSAPFQMKTAPALPGREPDLIFVSEEHRDRLQENHLAGPADLVVEVISPDSVTRDRVDKFREYAQGGVREYWLIDPLKRQADFLFLEGNAYRPLAVDEDGVVRSRVVEGLWLRVDWLWQDPLPSLLTVLKAWGLI